MEVRVLEVLGVVELSWVLLAGHKERADNHSLRRKYGIEEGDRVIFEEGEGGLILKPAADIADWAGTLYKYGDAGEVVQELLRERRKSFR